MICPCRALITNSFDIEKQSYEECCQPYHLGNVIPNTAEQLMRSRYSAFVLAQPDTIDYIIATTVPSQQSLLDRASLENWAKQTHWMGLEVLHHRAAVGKRYAQVEFMAFFDTSDGKQAHHELSTFIKINKKGNNANTTKPRWYFLDPTVTLTISQKQPCLCGSGEKFKRCCGQFLTN